MYCFVVCKNSYCNFIEKINNMSYFKSYNYYFSLYYFVFNTYINSMTL